MLAAIPEPASTENPKRHPLLPSLEKERNGSVPTRKPRAKQVPSRYLSPSPSTSTSSTTSTTTTTTSSSSSFSSSSRRFPSPLLSRSTNAVPSPTAFPKRSQSVDRRRPVSATRPVTSQGNAGANELSKATKMLVTSSRSLSVSFQGEAFSLPISKAKTATTPNSNRKPTPERRRATPVRDQTENSKPIEKQRWPSRSREINLRTNNVLSRSLDYSGDKSKVIGFGSGLVGKSLQQSLIDESSRRLSLDLGNVEQNKDGNFVHESDTDSVSSVSATSCFQECNGNGVSKDKNGSCGIVVSSRFWQETNSRLRRLQDPGSPLSTSPSSRVGMQSKVIQSKRFSSEGPLASPRKIASPAMGATRPASPSKLWASSASPLRGLSPARVRNAVGGLLNVNSINTPSILSFSVDVRRGKIGEDRIIDAHLLRLLYNRYLQWRFANARTDATFMVQRLNAEKILWNAWVTTSELRHSVTLKRFKLMLLRQKLKLASILKEQINYLEEWDLLDREHFSSLQGATEALKATTLRLPVVGKTTADIQDLKDAVGSAVDVMHAMASSICPLSSKVEDMNTLVSELVNTTAKEKALLQQCKDFLASLAGMQVKDCSLKTHIIQLNSVPTMSNLTTRV
ncbi:hypothetical protein HS088_TW18G00529 [Tripterygium wilfordii]|uniref:QWRF motif-containing protein 2 n=1 Tax=Tripterygium wilfordii TaxID=458696 RepID=A0A7J7CCE2_TRIWF|nr:QWRF motif-containing protein 2-like isoform X2 [Tripterygium wilfordii]KAF5731844.1 hypothetical protein HS088_TW18G00529 [Tripterygium wilfordii]